MKVDLWRVAVRAAVACMVASILAEAYERHAAARLLVAPMLLALGFAFGVLACEKGRRGD